eukprot:TRINITY_DN2066_c0_g1_i1.p2 TRINITY_DN2066_c0_g1~~TRINITY_DN2066_c0_g1_i1.p2  ORF type:complete len:107 (+),score=3.68 TRINITY_DN2066_c0_g1_i1:116-436(+)
MFDFHKWDEIPADVRHTFDYVVVDPPFITRDAWEKFAAATKLLAKQDGTSKILVSSVAENADMLNELLGLRPVVFQPSIPHLVYQYAFFTNYESTFLNERNPEIPE